MSLEENRRWYVKYNIKMNLYKQTPLENQKEKNRNHKNKHKKIINNKSSPHNIEGILVQNQI